jgi:hypothetical protein
MQYRAGYNSCVKDWDLESFDRAVGENESVELSSTQEAE